MERLKTFNYDEWRKRYLTWLSHNRNRITDHFHRKDRHGTGNITKEDFINIIIDSSEFILC
jgi:Ca2+-binding EF-hand superfamily protein